MLSIITPCSRPNNLPIIYSSLLELDCDVEWIVVYDSTVIDERIRMYEKDSVPIKLHSTVRGYGKGGTQRNKGLDVCSGDWIYYLDDDNTICSNIMKIINYCGRDDSILIVNQISELGQKKIGRFDINKVQHKGYVDTSQMVIPKTLKSYRWFDCETITKYEECYYINNIFSNIGYDKHVWVDGVYSYRNSLRKFDF
jgi:glycosyltransferase involved in cell wall biosynthesis